MTGAVSAPELSARDRPSQAGGSGGRAAASPDSDEEAAVESRAGAGARSIVTWNSDRAKPVIGTAAFRQYFWVRIGWMMYARSLGSAQLSEPTRRIVSTTVGTTRRPIRSVSGPKWS